MCSSVDHLIGIVSQLEEFVPMPLSTGSDTNAFANIADSDHVIPYEHSGMGQHYLPS